RSTMRLPLPSLNSKKVPAGKNNRSRRVGEPVRVPNGWTEYEEVLKTRFPAEADSIRGFFALCRSVFHVFEVVDEERLFLESWRPTLWHCFRRRPHSTAWMLLHRRFTLAQAFDREEFVAAMAYPDHERHDEFSGWIGQPRIGDRNPVGCPGRGGGSC